MEKWLQSVYSDGTANFVSNPLPKKGESITIQLRLFDNAPVTNVIFRAKINGVEVLQEMKKDHVKAGLVYYIATLKIYEDSLHYHFYLVTSQTIYYYNQFEITEYTPTETYDFRILTDYQQPSWVKNAVFYQIFPERFANGNPLNDCRDGEYTFDGHPTKQIKDWHQVPDFYTKSHALDFYGGDLEGIRMKIPYLKSLGVTALYLNPIFYAATVHKYDCLDYFKVDPHFGGEQALSDLTAELHKNGMKLILDVSLNHTGTAHKWFNKEATFFDASIGAYHNPSSPERNFYFFKPNNAYKCWFDVPTLPTLNYTSKALRDILYQSEDSLVKKWLKPPYEIDGWRFDVADIMGRNDETQLHHEIWPELRKSIKQVNPQAYILAEDWSDCSEFLQGAEWDAPMNYFGFARPVREFFGETDLFNRRTPALNNKPYKPNALHLKERILGHLSRMPYVIQQNQFNLLDSHDVPRLHTNSLIHPEEYKGAVIMLFTMPGTPNVYYGDEASCAGRLDDNEGFRYPMPWGSGFETSEQFRLYQTLSQLKTTKKAFSEGGFKIISNDHFVFSFARFTLDEVFVSVCSADSEPRIVAIPLGVFGKQAFTQINDALGTPLHYEIKNGSLRLQVAPHTSYLFEIC